MSHGEEPKVHQKSEEISRNVGSGLAGQSNNLFCQGRPHNVLPAISDGLSSFQWSLGSQSSGHCGATMKKRCAPLADQGPFMRTFPRSRPSSCPPHCQVHVADSTCTTESHLELPKCIELFRTMSCPRVVPQHHAGKVAVDRAALSLLQVT